MKKKTNLKIRKEKKLKGSSKGKRKPLTPSIDFPIVGIGASAGGLEAFMQFLAKVPKDSGMAFVLVQHLDPTHPSMSVDILSRSTRLPVKEVEDKMRVEPNHVYVIPPNHNLHLLNSILTLLPRTGSSGQHMTIDSFFQFLAQAKKSKAIGIVMSGTGSDGTHGLEAIKANGGITYVQEPSSAKYEGMPRHAIVAGIADFILRPEEMAGELVKLTSHPYYQSLEEDPRDDLEYSIPIDSPSYQSADDFGFTESLQKIFTLLRTHSKVDFSNYKFATIDRRIKRRMVVQKIKNFELYAEYLQAHPEEIKALYADILIHVTEFFRDPDSFDILAKEVFPTIVKDRLAQDTIRIWVSGCSTGEEVYSIAILLHEVLERAGKKNSIQIFATDISEPSIRKARLGLYPKSALKDVSKDRLKNFFEKIDDGYRVLKVIRDTCLFSVHDLTSDPPFAKLDLISCRNVMIYFAPALQKRVIPIFHFALKPKGILWLGKSETPGGFAKLFSLVDKKHKIYLKTNVPTPMNFHFPLNTISQMDRHKLAQGPPSQKVVLDFQKDADKILLSRFAPPSVIINADMEILQFRGRLAPFLEPDLSNNLFKIARTELLAGLRLLIKDVKKEEKPVRREGLHFKIGDTITRLNIEIVPTNPNAVSSERNYLVLFEQVTDSEKITHRNQHKTKKEQCKIDQDPKDQQIAELLLEIADGKELQQSLVDQYEATHEELTSANEELQSTNEEFQSTNEELETAKEELQSTNEELVTVNDELQIRNIDLTVLGSDLKNILSSMEIPILMIGSDKRIRRFTQNAEVEFSLIPSDVGRPIGDLKPTFDVNLETLVAEVIEKLNPKDIEVQDRKGAWRRIQIRPYKTIDNKLDGVIIALVDIDFLKQKEKNTYKAYEQVITVAETVPFPLAVVGFDLKLKSANHSFYKYFQITEAVVGSSILTILEVQNGSHTSLQKLFGQTLEADMPFKDFEIVCGFNQKQSLRVLVSGGKVHWTAEDPPAVLLSFVDVTERRRIEDERNLLFNKEREARAEAELANRAKDVFLANLSHELRTPLSAILTWAQMIQMGAVESEKIKDVAATIEKNAKAQSRIIDDLLDISRAIAGKLVLDIKEVSLAAVIEASVEAVRPLCEKNSIQVEVHLSPEEGLILADPVRLQQIIWNLLTNAVKFSPASSRVDVHLDFIGVLPERFAQISVRDRGKGIPAAFLPIIFNRFSQADSTSTRIQGGLGLGLSIVSHLVELQGGKVRAENAKEDVGAVFTVTFPLLLPLTKGPGDTVHTKGKSQERTNEGDDNPRLDGLNILFVDDDEATRDAISAHLRALGACVSSFASANEALKSLPSSEFHILISDIAMPEENGYMLIRKIRALSSNRGGKIPAIALSAYATTRDSESSIASGFQAHVTKPIEVSKLARTILKVLQVSKRMK